MRLNPLLMEKLGGPEEYAAGKDLEELGESGIVHADGLVLEFLDGEPERFDGLRGGAVVEGGVDEFGLLAEPLHECGGSDAGAGVDVNVPDIALVDLVEPLQFVLSADYRCHGTFC